MSRSPLTGRSAPRRAGVGRRGGNVLRWAPARPLAESAFLRGLSAFDIEGPAPEDLDRMAELVKRYADFPLGGTDASSIVLAERIGATVIITLDRRHFAAVRPHHTESFEILP